MEVSQLKSFLTIAKLGNLTRAAETLHLSQPALSGQIKSLEENLGVSLFQRSSTGMALTPSGKRLLPHAESVIGAVQHLGNLAQALRDQPTGKLTVGTVLDATVLRVGDLLARMAEKYPQIEIELHQVVSHEALAGIRNGTLDASFYFGARPAPDIDVVPLRDITYRVALPTAWADELRKASWDTLASRPWIVAPEESSHRQLILELFKGRALLPGKIIEADSESVIANLVESGIGASLLRDEIAHVAKNEARVAIWPGAQSTTTLWLAYAAQGEGDPLLAAVLDALEDVWAVAEHV